MASGLAWLRRRTLPLAASLAVLWAVDAGALDPAAVSEGGELFQVSCAACHGADATGHGPVVPALKTPPPDLTQLATGNGGVFPRDRVIQVIAGERQVTAHGTREMPVWCQRFAPTGSGATAAASIYARRQLEFLATYIESVQRAPRPRP